METVLHNKQGLFFISILFFLFCYSCADQPDSQMQQVENECSRLTRNNLDFNRSDSLANLMLDHARRYDNKELEAKALYYLGVYDYNPEHAETRRKYLDQCMSMLQPGRDDSLLLKVYTAMGIYEAAYYRRYTQGAHYFTKSLEIAKALKDERKIIIAEQNLSAIMVFTGDTLGIVYDEDIFKYAKRVNDTTLLYRSATHCGIYYSRQKFDEQKARYYANVVKGSSIDYGYHKIMGYIYMHNRQFKEAEQEMLTVIKEVPNDLTASLAYANLLNQMGQWEKSNHYLDISDSLYSDDGRFGVHDECTRIRAANYAALGNMKEAYIWEKAYSVCIDSIQNLKQREIVTSTRIMFDTQKKEHTIALQKERMKILVMWICFIVLFFVIAISSLLIYIRKRNRRYKQIVENSRMAAIQEQSLRDIIKSQDL
ncbi:MAG: tetratricopeptide repeat protein [Lepagella sp.]